MRKNIGVKFEFIQSPSPPNHYLYKGNNIQFLCLSIYVCCLLKSLMK